MKERIKDINPECEVIALKMFYTEETYEEFFSHQLDYVVDASDTIAYKIHLIKECLNRNIILFQVWVLQIKWIQPDYKSRTSLKNTYRSYCKSYPYKT